MMMSTSKRIVSTTATVDDLLAIIAERFESGRRQEVWEAIRGECTQHSLRAWIKDPKKARNAAKVRNGALERIVNRLYADDGSAFLDNYRFSLSEMSMSVESQFLLHQYEGSYYFLVNIDESEFKVTNFSIRISKNNVPVFIMKADDKKCDGFVFYTGGRIIFSGLSDYLNAFIIVNKSVDPDTDPLFGMMTVEHKFRNKCFAADVCLLPRNSGNKEKLLDFRKTLHVLKHL
jgi:hypothetical protein